MKRREFLKSLMAVAIAPTLPVVATTGSSAAELDEITKKMLVGNTMKTRQPGYTTMNWKQMYAHKIIHGDTHHLVNMRSA